MATLLDDLVAFWPLDEASGNALDAHTNGIDLTETGGTIDSADGGRDFEAVDTEYFATADSALLSAPSTSLTIDCWVKFESLPASQMDIVSKYETTSPTNNREYRVWWNNTTNRLSFDISTAGSSASRAEVAANNFGNVSTGVWMHVTAWYDHDRNCVFIQVDGGEPDCTFLGATTGIFDGAGPFHIGALGRASPAQYFDGVIKGVGLWKRNLSADERSYLYNSGSGPRSYGDLNTTVAISAQSGVLATNMIWTWFTTPVADYYNGKAWIGGFENTATQRARIAEYTIADGSAVVTNLSTDLAQTDDHNNPSIKRLASGKLLATYQPHGGQCYSQLSTNVDDGTAWGSAVSGSTGVAYSQLAQVTHNSRIYRFQRTGSVGQVFDYSDNDGASWTAHGTNLLDNGAERPYPRYWNTSGTRIDCVCTNGQPGEVTCSLYHFYIDINASTGARNYYKSDGTLIGTDATLPLEISDLTQVYDGTTNQCWIWDCRYVNGQITCLFAVFVGGNTAHEYWRGRWNGSSWDTEKICDGGTTGTADYLYAAQPNYSGGACLDPLDEDVVYVSREFSATDFRIHRFEKSGSWAASTFLSQGQGGINARPVAINADGTTHVFWWSGRYNSYTNYQTAVYAHPAPQAASGTAPTISTTANHSIGENQTAVTTMAATGDEPITWSIIGGADQSLFTIDTNTGALSFLVAPNYEDPDDADTNNIYIVQVRATNGAGTADQTKNITVTDVDETGRVPQGPVLASAMSPVNPPRAVLRALGLI